MVQNQKTRAAGVDPPSPCSGYSCSRSLATMRGRPSESKRFQPKHHSAFELSWQPSPSKRSQSLSKLLGDGLAVPAAESSPGRCTHRDTNGSGHKPMVIVCRPQFSFPAGNPRARGEGADGHARPVFTEGRSCSTFLFSCIDVPSVQLFT